MMPPNLTRMLQLVDEVFQVHNDPYQLNVDEKIIDQLRSIHPSTVSENSNEDGPYMWILLIPSNSRDMQDFIDKKINETQLFRQALKTRNYDCIYLCSAITLPEYRNKGLSKQTTLRAIRSMMNDFPIRSLFVWNFSKEGDLLSAGIARELNLPLFHRH